MNYYDAIQIRLRAARGQAVDRDLLQAANEYVKNERAQQQVQAAKVRAEMVSTPLPILSPNQVKPPMAVLCACGARYGMHSYGSYACPNGDRATASRSG